MLADKDAMAALRHIHVQISDWHLASVNSPRSENPQKLKKIISALGTSPVSVHASVANAWIAIKKATEAGDRIVVFGSFYTVSEAMVVAQEHGQRI